MGFAIVWTNQEPMTNLKTKIDQFLNSDKLSDKYGRGIHFFVPAEYANSLQGTDL